MNTNVTVLMYHAVADAFGKCAGADPHYCVATARFAGQLQQVAAQGKRCVSVVSLLKDGMPTGGAVALTFDDGHASNRAAAELLARSGASADFFVNPSTVGTPNFLTWDALREMAACGMSIQSHGFHHRYLDELSTREVHAELADSKRAIEDRLGAAVTVFAPPGGRVSPTLAQVAKDCGYSAICASRVGLWRGAHEAWDIPRLAVLHSTTDQQFNRWVRQDPLELFGRRARYAVLHNAKRILGNRGYERLRQGLLGGAG